jgi:hypothetical protein
VADGSIGPVGAIFLDPANIYVIDPSGTISTVPGSPFPPGPSARLAVDSQDRLYILTSTNVLRVTPGSAPAVFLPALPPSPSFFSAIGIGSSDTVNLMDVRNNQVLTFSQGGKNSGGFPTRSTPLAIASDALGNLWEASTLGLAEATRSFSAMSTLYRALDFSVMAAPSRRLECLPLRDWHSHPTEIYISSTPETGGSENEWCSPEESSIDHSGWNRKCGDPDWRRSRARRIDFDFWIESGSGRAAGLFAGQ